MGMQVELNCDVFPVTGIAAEFTVTINKDSRDEDADQELVVTLNGSQFDVGFLTYAQRNSYYPTEVLNHVFDKEAVERMLAEIVTAHQMINAGVIPTGF